MPEYKLIIYCVECTVEKRKTDRYWPAISFSSLNEAVAHINETKHEVIIDLEAEYRED